MLMSKFIKRIRTFDAPKTFSQEEAKAVGDKIGVDWTKHSIENFTIGMNVELEHGLKYPKTNITNDDPIMTGKIALVHMNEAPGTGAGDDYYTLLKKHVDPKREMKDDLPPDLFVKQLSEKIIQARKLMAYNTKRGRESENQTIRTYVRFWEQRILDKGYPIPKGEAF